MVLAAFSPRRWPLRRSRPQGVSHWPRQPDGPGRNGALPPSIRGGVSGTGIPQRARLHHREPISERPILTCVSAAARNWVRLMSTSSSPASIKECRGAAGNDDDTDCDVYGMIRSGADLLRALRSRGKSPAGTFEASPLIYGKKLETSADKSKLRRVAFCGIRPRQAQSIFEANKMARDSSICSTVR